MRLCRRRMPLQALGTANLCGRSMFAVGLERVEGQGFLRITIVGCQAHCHVVHVERLPDLPVSLDAACL